MQYNFKVIDYYVSNQQFVFKIVDYSSGGDYQFVYIPYSNLPSIVMTNYLLGKNLRGDSATVSFLKDIVLRDMGREGVKSTDIAVIKDSVLRSKVFSKSLGIKHLNYEELADKIFSSLEHSTFFEYASKTVGFKVPDSNILEQTYISHVERDSTLSFNRELYKDRIFESDILEQTYISHVEKDSTLSFTRELYKDRIFNSDILEQTYISHVERDSTLSFNRELYRDRIFAGRLLEHFSGDAIRTSFVSNTVKYQFDNIQGRLDFDLKSGLVSFRSTSSHSFNLFYSEDREFTSIDSLYADHSVDSLVSYGYLDSSGVERKLDDLVRLNVFSYFDKNSYLSNSLKPYTNDSYFYNILPVLGKSSEFNQSHITELGSFGQYETSFDVLGGGQLGSKDNIDFSLNWHNKSYQYNITSVEEFTYYYKDDKNSLVYYDDLRGGRENDNDSVVNYYLKSTEHDVKVSLLNLLPSSSLDYLASFGEGLSGSTDSKYLNLEFIGNYSRLSDFDSSIERINSYVKDKYNSLISNPTLFNTVDRQARPHNLYLYDSIFNTAEIIGFDMEGIKINENVDINITLTGTYLSTDSVIHEIDSRYRLDEFESVIEYVFGSTRVDEFDFINQESINFSWFKEFSMLRVNGHSRVAEFESTVEYVNTFIRFDEFGSTIEYVNGFIRIDEFDFKHQELVSHTWFKEFSLLSIGGSTKIDSKGYINDIDTGTLVYKVFNLESDRFKSELVSRDSYLMEFKFYAEEVTHSAYVGGTVSFNGEEKSIATDTIIYRTSRDMSGGYTLKSYSGYKPIETIMNESLFFVNVPRDASIPTHLNDAEGPDREVEFYIFNPKAEGLDRDVVFYSGFNADYIERIVFTDDSISKGSYYEKDSLIGSFDSYRRIKRKRLQVKEVQDNDKLRYRRIVVKNPLNSDLVRRKYSLVKNFTKEVVRDARFSLNNSEVIGSSTRRTRFKSLDYIFEDDYKRDNRNKNIDLDIKEKPHKRFIRRYRLNSEVGVVDSDRNNRYRTLGILEEIGAENLKEAFIHEISSVKGKSLLHYYDDVLPDKAPPTDWEQGYFIPEDYDSKDPFNPYYPWTKDYEPFILSDSSNWDLFNSSGNISFNKGNGTIQANGTAVFFIRETPSGNFKMESTVEFEGDGTVGFIFKVNSFNDFYQLTLTTSPNSANSIRVHRSVGGVLSTVTGPPLNRLNIVPGVPYNVRLSYVEGFLRVYVNMREQYALYI